VSHTSYTSGFAVTPSDTATFSRAKALYIGTAGTLKVTMAGAGGAVVTFANAAVGLLPIEVVQVFATGTSATGIVALL
jgi:hypothetical protein